MQPSPHEFRFRKAEKLHSRTLVDALFRSGKSIYAWPLRLVWRQFSSEDIAKLFPHGLPPKFAPVQVMISVPKKKRRHAVDRVLLRRRIREAYRLSRIPTRDSIIASGVHTTAFALIFMAEQNISYDEIAKSMNKIWSKLGDKL